MAKHQNRKKVDKKIRALEAQGFKVIRTRNQHLRILHPDGQRTGMWSSANGEARSTKNIRSQFKNLGIEGVSAQ